MEPVRLALAAAAALALLGAGARAFADEPKAAIEGVDDKALRQAIERVVGTSKRAAQTRFEARRRAQDAAEDAVIVLRSEGYYQYSVVPDVGEGAPPRPVLRIDPGPRFTIAAPTVSWTGDAPAAEAVKDAVAAVQLPTGAPGRAADVVAAEGRIVAALHQDGYADSEAQPREVVVDHADLTVRPAFRIAAGERIRLDGVKLNTAGRTNPRWVARLAPWRAGQLYTPDAVAELERRLLDTGVYDSVNVALSPQDDAQGQRQVLVSLADRPKATVALGASYSTSEGVGVTGRYSLYNRFRRADTLTLSAQYAKIMKRVDLDLSLPHWRQAQRTLKLGATAYKDDTDAYEAKDVGVHADLERRFGKTSFRTYGVSLDYSQDNEKSLVGGQIVGISRRFAIATGLASLTLDRSDDPLDPHRGWRFDGRLEPTAGWGDGTLAYVKAQGQVTGYLPLGKAANTVIAGRVKVGSILSTRGTVYVPASRRYYAGGAGSIRGYAYQAVGPRFPDRTPMGGQSLFETSAEVRQMFGPRWGAVAFVDAGNVSGEKYPDFKTFSMGAGVGLRYNLGFAPLRVDFAVPLNRRAGDGPFQVYLSIGQSF